MAFFKSLFQAKAPAPPRLRSGMRVEVLDSDGALLFPGRLRVLEDGILEVRRTRGPTPPLQSMTSRSSSGAPGRTAEPLPSAGT